METLSYCQLMQRCGELEAQRDAVVVESAIARDRHRFIRALAVSILEHSGGRHDWRGAMEDASELIKTVDGVYSQFPAIDAAIAAMRAEAKAEALDEMAATYRGYAKEDDCSCNMKSSYNLTAERAENYAAYVRRQLRESKGEVQS